MADRDYSLNALMEFLHFVSDKGLMNSSTAQGYRVALSKIEDVLTDQEREDVRRIDADVAFQKFVNKNGTALSPNTVREYQRRVDSATLEFQKWREDPAGYKPRGTTARRSSTAKEEKAPAKKRKGDRERSDPKAALETPSVPEPVKGMLEYPFPLRPDFLARVVIPRDMTKEEAERLTAFISALAVDFRTK